MLSEGGQKEPAESTRRRAAKAALHHRLVEMGLMSQSPEAPTELNEPDEPPIEINGEPLSADIIRERR